MTETVKASTIALIDDLKSTCQFYGLGNDGNEYKIITQVFLYKFLNDKFGYEVKRLRPELEQAPKWEAAYAAMTKDDRLDLLDELSPDIPRLEPKHLISTLWNNQTKGDFDLIFDATMVDIANENIDIFSTQTTEKTRIPLFERLTIYVTDEAQRAPFARALVDKLVNFSFEEAFIEHYDFFAAIFEYLTKITTRPAAASTLSTTSRTPSPPSWRAFSLGTIPICTTSSATTHLPVPARSLWR
ncbi:hypothetical protein [Rubneribacter badeniensis]|uniref:hypothetical protein n=1 Tax=Rubneribacter badeniensis TaxID=2070688 RepID=UPI003A91513A